MSPPSGPAPETAKRSLPPRWRVRLPAGRERWLLVAAVLVAIYGIAGFLVAPPLLRGRVEREASALIGRDVALDRLRLNPFALSVTLDGLLIKDKDGTIIGSAGASGGTGEEDEACCVAGIEAAGLTADASA